jgi:hypothetical protein
MTPPAPSPPQSISISIQNYIFFLWKQFLASSFQIDQNHVTSDHILWQDARLMILNQTINMEH